MSALHATRRGHPLVFMGGLMIAWLGMRAATWETPIEVRRAVAELEERALAPFGGAGRVVGSRSGPAGAGEETGAGAWPMLGVPPPPVIRVTLDPPSAAAPGDRPGDRPFDRPFAARAASVSADAGKGQEASAAGSAVGHALLAMMGLSQMQVPPMLARLVDLGRRSDAAPRLAQSDDVAPQPVAPARPSAVDTALASVRRWSADAWVLVREGGSGRASAAEQPSYGRSQAGAVLRYRLAPSSAHAPQAYARVNSAIERPRDAELAGGLSARPFPRVPVRVAAEVRVIDAEGGADVRPAAYVITEFPPLDLPLGARGEVYAQAGYVGGDFGTPFIDGQARVTRDFARIGRATVSAGAAAWGGAQKDASRLDVGPTAAVSFSIGEVFSRLSIDYRVRVAGDAEPASGPVLTLSTGF